MRIEDHRGVAVRTRKVPVTIDGYIYALRDRIERCVTKRKNSRRVGARYDKTAESYLGFIDIAAFRLRVTHVVHAS